MHTAQTPRARFTSALRVRPADVGAAGVAHGRAFLVYFEAARVEALRGLGVAIAE